MITNDIEERVRHGSFTLSLKFGLFGINQNIVHATFDTGCSHSLISANSLNLGSKNIEEIEHMALMDYDILLSVGV